MVLAAGGLLALGIVGADRLPVCLDTDAAVPDRGYSRAWSFRVAASDYVLASACIARPTRDLKGCGKQMG